VVAPGASVGGCGEPGLGDAYTYLQPCAGERGLNGRLSVQVADVCSWGDGVHSVKGAATDTGGAEVMSSTAVTVRVDCTAPVVAISPTGDREVTAGTAVAPVVSAQDVRVAVASTEVQMQIGTQAWVPYSGPLAAQAGSYYRFRARATDSLGNTSAWVVSAWTKGVLEEPAAPPVETATAPTPATPAALPVGAIAPPALDSPVVAPTPLDPPPAVAPRAAPAPRAVVKARARVRGRTISITGTAPVAFHGRVAITVTTRTGRKTRRFAVTAIAENGRFAARIRLPKHRRTVRIVNTTAKTRPDPLR
jgi:hypothetical protein